MPRDSSNIYTQPYPDVVGGTTVESVVYNGFVNDVEIDLNSPRPIIAGGTGATNADAALAQLTAEKASQQVTNFDSQVWQPGSFYSLATATNPPVAGHAFTGSVYVVDVDNIILAAIDQDDTVLPPRQYMRQKKAGVWGAWQILLNPQGLYVQKAGDSMTGLLNINATGTEQLVLAITPTDGNSQVGVTGTIAGTRYWEVILATGGPFIGQFTIGSWYGSTFTPIIVIDRPGAAGTHKVTINGNLHVNGVITHTP